MEHLWLGIPVFVLLWISFILPIPLLDFWWHLKMGEVIATTRSIPRTDIFSFTAAGHPFVAQNWLAELIFYWTYKIGGIPLNIFLTSMLTLLGSYLSTNCVTNALIRCGFARFWVLLAALGNYSINASSVFLCAAAFYSVLPATGNGGETCFGVFLFLWRFG
jgi:hypothetical protein